MLALVFEKKTTKKKTLLAVKCNEVLLTVVLSIQEAHNFTSNLSSLDNMDNMVAYESDTDFRLRSR